MKTALNSICKNLAVELKDKGVVVVVIHLEIVKVCPHHGIANQLQTNLLSGNEAPKEAVGLDEAGSKLYNSNEQGLNDDSEKFWHGEGRGVP